jgi:hypothetical protein
MPAEAVEVDQELVAAEEQLGELEQRGLTLYGMTQHRGSNGVGNVFGVAGKNAEQKRVRTICRRRRR